MRGMNQTRDASLHCIVGQGPSRKEKRLACQKFPQVKERSFILRINSLRTLIHLWVRGHENLVVRLRVLTIPYRGPPTEGEIERQWQEIAVFTPLFHPLQTNVKSGGLSVSIEESICAALWKRNRGGGMATNSRH